MTKFLFLLLLNVLAFDFSKAQNDEDRKLALAPVFSDHMVLQRNKPIKIYGTATGGSDVSVQFSGQTGKAKADQSGKWNVVFPAVKAGGPHVISVSVNGQKINVKDILIGDVWLCSGQSNMEFQLKDAQSGPEELKQKDFSQHIRLLKFSSAMPWGNVAWDSAALAKVNLYAFFKGSWKTLDAASAASFSAIGYYFGKQLIKETDIPIGLIQVALGGSPTESWIDRALLEQDQQFAGMLTDWPHSTLVMDWCRERAAKNTSNAHSSDQRHPFQPGYNFQAGIAPLTGFPVAGVIWYQGESNVFNVQLHEQLFTKLVKSWREDWRDAFPFYYVQLSSIDRPNWPEFRDSQRKLLTKIPNSGMAVSYDFGDSLNVHPIRKKEVGERLALLALRNHYRKPVQDNGQVPEKATFINGEIRIQFLNEKATSAQNKALPKQKLLTKNNAALTGFEVVTESGKRMLANAWIEGDEVVMNVPSGERIKTVLYAYQPFTHANLYNEAGLPASTFSIAVN